jgi:hypothetical protein
MFAGYLIASAAAFCSCQLLAAPAEYVRPRRLSVSFLSFDLCAFNCVQFNDGCNWEDFFRSTTGVNIATKQTLKKIWIYR